MHFNHVRRLLLCVLSPESIAQERYTIPAHPHLAVEHMYDPLKSGDGIRLAACSADQASDLAVQCRCVACRHVT